MEQTIHVVSRLLKTRGLTAEQVAELLAAGASTTDVSLGQGGRLLRDLARDDPRSLWLFLAVPGFSGDLLQKLHEIRDILRGQLERYDAFRALAAARKLLIKFQAALDIIVNAYAFETRGAPLGLWRYLFTEGEVCWYDPSMAPAIFHLGDVDRLHDFDKSTYSSSDGPKDASTIVMPAQNDNGESCVQEKTMHAKQSSQRGSRLTTPRRLRRSLKSEATYYRRTQKADLRWHVPLQDATRPGCAGGLRPMPRGQTIRAQVTTDLMRFTAARPRPTGMPAPVPSCPEAEGSLFAGAGGAAIRQVLCDLEPVSCLRQLTSQGKLLADLLHLIRHFEGKLDFQLRSVSKVVYPKAGTAGLDKELQTRRNMMEAVASKVQLPEWTVFTDLPVLPPDLRTRSPNDPMEYPDDLNVMYKDILRANKIVRDSLHARVASGLLRYLKFQLQNSLDALLDNNRAQKPTSKPNGDVLESVAARLKGKQGRMRKNMLGKRVDYSARTVIVVDPLLKLDECGLPFVIAKDLFRNFLLHEIYKELPELSDGGADKWFDEQPDQKQWDLVERAVGDRAILLNRAPTLHRLSLQAFRPKVIRGQALKIHPLVCAPFNADFDGDTMTIHLALCETAQQELRTLMMPSRNLSSPATGDPVIGPTQDMVLGIYYLTAEPTGERAPVNMCRSLEDLQSMAAACAAGDLSHHTAVSVPREVLVQAVGCEAAKDDPLLNSDNEELRTTAGRLLFFLMMHQGFNPPMRLHADLLDDLDSTPLCETRLNEPFAVR